MTFDSTSSHDHRFPGESEDYREARNKLLMEEQILRDQIERVAALRRELPAGGLLQEDYVFEEIEFSDGDATPIKFSQLFGDKNDLLVYSYMFGPNWVDPCPSCTSFIDGADRMSRHVRRQVEMVIVAKSTPKQIYDIATERGWSDVRLLSSEQNTYTQDYQSQPGVETKPLMPLMNVFHRDGDEIRHFWASEMLWTSTPGRHPRHIDIAWPLWALLDMTRAGRHPTMGPELRY